MAKPQQVIKLRVTYKDVFSVKGLYKVLRQWLAEEGYCGLDSTDKWIENLYVERIGANGGKEIWIWWRTSKEVDGNFKFILNVDFHLLNMQPSEIMHEGKKMKTDVGEVDVEFYAFLQFDPKGEWDDHFFLSNPLVSKWWLNKAYKRSIDKKAEELYKDAYRLQSAMKQYLELKAFLHEYTGKPFHPYKFPTA
ncbi:hypothetical protein HOK51_02795 [Candidatus Woesearchaeota archaeon]|jgi:hypothetical protein|nr:hypothetical protein [Candidatus Woesearchaeota archaeon]MBT6518745.1 hypothetical protein [Candidatus Woesearchaeota archaeon]MBT7366945.1 hypothetical protein [Candidatus Woesearchaeota archaeon]